jgi:hypothetical protein
LVRREKSVLLKNYKFRLIFFNTDFN